MIHGIIKPGDGDSKCWCGTMGSREIAAWPALDRAFTHAAPRPNRPHAGCSQLFRCGSQAAVCSDSQHFNGTRGQPTLRTTLSASNDGLLQSPTVRRRRGAMAFDSVWLEFVFLANSQVTKRVLFVLPPAVKRKNWYWCKTGHRSGVRWQSCPRNVFF